MKLLRRLRPDGRTALIITCTALLAVGITSIATGAAGNFVRIGKRNAAPGTTAIVGSTTGFSTRQSNNTDGDGGAASYGCRADTGKEACLFVLNHHNGRVHFAIRRCRSSSRLRPRRSVMIARGTTTAASMTCGIRIEK